MKTKLFVNDIIFITGGTGTVGRLTVDYFLKTDCRKIIIYSRDEYKQKKMMCQYTDKRLRFFIGDICDLPRLKIAMKEATRVIHTAAMKHVDLCEYNPTEAIRVNILGTQNVCEAARENDNVVNCILISTDKAVEPISMYGKTKGVCEDLFINYNRYVKKYNVLRLGNILGSRGSIIDLIGDKSIKSINLTDPEATRFFVTPDAYKLVLAYIMGYKFFGVIMLSGISKSFKLVDLIDCVSDVKLLKYNVVGLAQHEKKHEKMVAHGEECVLETNHMFTAISKLGDRDTIRLEFNEDSSHCVVSKSELAEIIKELKGEENGK